MQFDDVESDLNIITGLLAEIEGQYLIDSKTGKVIANRLWWQVW